MTEYQTVDAGKLSSNNRRRTQADLRELEAAAETSTKAYDNFIRMLRYMEAQQQSSNSEAHLLIEASRPLEASSPKAPIVLGISTAGGVLLGIALGMLRDLFGRGIRSSGDATPGHRLWLPVQHGNAAVAIRTIPSAVLSLLRRQNPREEAGAPGAHAGLRRGSDA